MAKPQTEPNLPAAGYERNEELKRREDNLQEQAETRASEVEVGAGSILDVKVENELASRFDELEVQGALPEYAYSWTPTHTTGRFVQQKLYKGWVIVQGEMPEAAALKGTDTTRKLGDVILMRIHKDKKAVIDRREEMKKIQQEEGVTSLLQELAERANTQIYEGDNISPDMLQRMQRRSEAQTRASKMKDRWIKEGRVPGLALR